MGSLSLVVATSHVFYVHAFAYCRILSDQCIMTLPMTRTANFVSKKGKSLLMILGTSRFSSAFNQAIVEKIVVEVKVRHATMNEEHIQCKF